MFKILISILLSLIFSLGSLSQEEKTSYFGINIPPLFGTTLELGYELNIKSNLSLDVYGGYTFNNELESKCFEENEKLKVNKMSGGFFKLGVRYNWRKNLNRFAPFIGVNLVNSISIEEGTQEIGGFINNEPTISLEQVVSNRYNLGISGIIGITSNSTKKINLDFGVQFGRLIVNNLLSCKSYMPGMGIVYNENRIQGVFRIKYRIN